MSQTTAGRLYFNKQAPREPVNPYDPDRKTRRHRRKLPHWEQAGCAIYLTFRLADSLPVPVIREWKAERLRWLQIHAKSSGTDWRTLRDSLPIKDRTAYGQRFTAILDEKLDQGLGECILRDPENARIVADALRHFDGTRYHLGDFVIMPNHVHVLLAPVNGWTLDQITHSWKSFTSQQINRRLGRKGQLWQHESFDHLIRSTAYLEKYRKYIADNPRNIPSGQFVYCESSNSRWDKLEPCALRDDKLEPCALRDDKLEACPTLTAIVAMTPERIIGRDGELPWHLPEDLQFFKRTTGGHPIIMGRKTFESIGRPLPKRQNIVLTRDRAWAPDGIRVRRPADDFPSQTVTEGTGGAPLPELTVIHDPHQVAELDLIDPHAFIIGGAQIYQLFLPLLDELLVSRVHASHPGDTRFPEFEHLFPTFTVLEEHEQFEVRRYCR